MYCTCRWKSQYINKFTARKTSAWRNNLLLGSYQVYTTTIKQTKQTELCCPWADSNPPLFPFLHPQPGSSDALKSLAAITSLVASHLCPLALIILLLATAPASRAASLCPPKADNTDKKAQQIPRASLSLSACTALPLGAQPFAPCLAIPQQNLCSCAQQGEQE